jgi:ribosomal protein S21
MIEVKVRGTTEKALDDALHFLKKLLDKEGVFQEMRDRAYFRSDGRKQYEKKRSLVYKMQLKQLKTEKYAKKKWEKK